MATFKQLVEFGRAKAPLDAEFLGTGILTLTFLIMAGYINFPFYIGLSAGLALTVVYILFGHVSGAHANPALTFGLWTARRISTLRAVAYIAAQLLGALAAWQLFQYLTGRPVEVGAAEFSGPVFVGEMIGAAVLAMGLCAALNRGFEAMQTALAYGLAFFVAILITALTLTSNQGFVGFANPAVALGFRHWGAGYILGPLVGAAVGVNLYYWLFAGNKKR